MVIIQTLQHIPVIPALSAVRLARLQEMVHVRRASQDITYPQQQLAQHVARPVILA